MSSTPRGTDAEGEPVEVGEYDPVEDVDFVEEEMDLWLAGIVDRNWESVVRQSRSPDFDSTNRSRRC